MARVFEGHRRDQIHVRCVDSSGAAPPVVAAATASASSTAAASSSSAASTVALSSATAATVASIATVVGGCEEAATLARDATPPQVLEPLPRQPATCLYLCSRLPRASAPARCRVLQPFNATPPPPQEAKAVGAASTHILVDLNGRHSIWSGSAIRGAWDPEDGTVSQGSWGRSTHS